MTILIKKILYVVMVSMLLSFSTNSTAEDLTELPDIVKKIQNNNDALAKDVELFNKIVNKTMASAPTCRDKCTIAEGACLIGCCSFGACNPACNTACVAAYAVCLNGCDNLSSKENGKDK